MPRFNGRFGRAWEGVSRGGAPRGCVFRATIPLVPRSGPKSGAGNAFFPCGRGHSAVYRACPISHVPVAACRLVGIRSTAGQPPGVLKDRWSQGWIPTAGIRVATPDPNNNRQPEAKPANPALHGGRSLKQRRTGFFGLAGSSKGRHRRGLFILARRAVGVPPSNPRQLPGCYLRPLTVSRLQSAKRKRRIAPRRRRLASGPSRFDLAPERRRLEPVVGTTNDRSHPRLPARAP